MNNWLCLIASLPTENATLRQRTWRALKSSGAAVLRDGVYLMPEREDCRSTLDRLRTEVREGGGAALVLRVEEPADVNFKDQFDRSSQYSDLLADIARAHSALTPASALEIVKKARKLRKTYTAIADIDFFSGEAQRHAELALSELELACVRASAPDEPHDVAGTIQQRDATEYQGRIWATRRRPWVDRLASAWLIRRFIDPQAQILWLVSPEDCPAAALGFDFDGAAFSHVGGKVTFEVLLTSFGLVRPGLLQLGLIVHYLDVGGAPPPEAVGVESVLSGLRDTITEDDQLLTAACAVFDGLLAGLEKGIDSP
ncbi:MAG: chromate resistance protein ChrB domain-containing protein [Gammaproteobacteria bacterium]